MSAFLVLLLGAVIVLAGCVTVTRRNPVHAAVSMLVALIGVAALMLGMRSPFLAAMQILLYTGAIMVLFVFVIMLLSLREEELGEEPGGGKKLGAAVGSVLLLAVLLFSLSHRDSPQLQKPYHQAQLEQVEAARGVPVARRDRVDFGSTEHFARFLYTDYAVPFELITVLIMAAIAGVIVLARKPEKITLEETTLTEGPPASGGGTHP